MSLMLHRSGLGRVSGTCLLSFSPGFLFFLIVTKLYRAVFPFLTLAPLDSPLLAGIVIFYLGGEPYSGLEAID